MLTWEKGPPVSEGLYVVHWMNAGGYAVYRVCDYDGILFARSMEFSSDHRCTRLDKWAIKYHLRISDADLEELQEAFRKPAAKVKTKK